MPITKPVCNGSTQTWLDATNALLNLFGNSKKAATVSIFGDSFTAYHYFSDVGNNYQNSTLQSSCWRYVAANLGSQINITNFAGVGGDQASDMLARLQVDILDKNTDYVFGQVGVNDFFGGFKTATQVFDDVVDMIEQIIANGSKVVWLNCYPQPSTRGGFTAARSLELANYNKMLADWAQDVDGVIIVDVYSRSVDHNDSVNGEALASLYIGPDKVHLTDYGSWDTGEAFLESLAPFMVKDSNTADMSPLTQGDYLALTQTNFNGTGGTLLTGGAGVVPDLWVLKRNSGAGTITGSVTSEGYYKLSMNNTSGSSVYRLQTFNAKALFSGGENIKSRLALSIEMGSLQIEEIRCYWYVFDGTSFYTVENGRSINGYTPISPMDSTDIVLDLQPTLMPAGPFTDVVYYIDFRVTGAAIGDVILKNLRLWDA